MIGTQQCSISEVNNNGNSSIQIRIKYSLLGPLQTEKSDYLCGSSLLLRDAHQITGSQEQVTHGGAAMPPPWLLLVPAKPKLGQQLQTHQHHT